MLDKVCRYFHSETVQGVFHRFCKNQNMLEKNKINEDKMTCTDIICNQCIYFEINDIVKKDNE